MDELKYTLYTIVFYRFSYFRYIEYFFIFDVIENQQIEKKIKVFDTDCCFSHEL